MIALLMIGSIINYLTRSTLGVAAPTILRDLHITAQQYSWIVGTFQGAIMFSLVIGALVARIGYTPFFISLGVLDLVGALILWTLVREPQAEPTPASAAA
jgi:MFS family permease